MSPFDHKTYKSYLKARSGQRGSRSGVKSALAGAMHCQTTYLSRVLNGDADLSLEQAEAINRFLQHTDEEGHFFLLMVQAARAGTPTLKSYFQRQLNQISAKRALLRERVAGDPALGEADQAEYYSSWHYAALHIGVTVPELQTREALSHHFRLPHQRVARVLEYLTKVGMVREERGRFLPSQARLMLGSDSPNIIRHHANWRNRAIDSLETEMPEELHYSAVVSMSRSDLEQIKENLLQAIQKNLAVLKDSREEEVFCCCLDFFDLHR